MDEPLVTQLLNRFCAGDASLEDEVVARIHAELRELAARQMARQPAAMTLQPTALVHEAWLRLAEHSELEFGARRQFFRFAGTLMRNLLIDVARSAAAGRRKERLSVTQVELPGSDEEADARAVDVLDLEAALERLEAREPELVRVVELHFFCGLSQPEIAEVLDCSLSSVERRWRFARAWLASQLEADEA